MRDTRDFEQWQQSVGTPTPPSSPRAALPTRIFAAPPPVMLPVGVSGALPPTYLTTRPCCTHARTTSCAGATAGNSKIFNVFGFLKRVLKRVFF